jgi:signal peptidase I
MVGTLLIGDHVLVDKLVYSPKGRNLGGVLPYRGPRRGDIIVFRYPLLIAQDYVKRHRYSRRPHPPDRSQADAQRQNGRRALRRPQPPDSPELYRDNFPRCSTVPAASARSGDDRQVRARRRAGSAAGFHLSPWATTATTATTAASGAWSRFENIVGTPLIIYWCFDTDTAALTNGTSASITS